MLSDLTHIPRIMRSRGWMNGARLLETWFSRSRSVAPRYTGPDTTTIRMDRWVLKFPRARRRFDEILRERIWANSAAQRVVADMLRRKGLLGRTPHTFGTLGSSVVAQDPDYVNFRAMGETADFDDLTAALGAFTFRVLVAGTVAPRPGPPPSATAFDVSITEIGVYVRDSFDFEGDQYLAASAQPR